MLCTLIGAFVGAEYHKRFRMRFTSRYVIQITPRISGIIDGCWGETPTVTQDSEHVQHNLLIANKASIKTCLERFPELKSMASFCGLCDERIADKIARNIKVTEDRESTCIYKLTYPSRHPADGTKVLVKLVENYRELLDAQLKNELDETTKNLRATNKELKPREISAFQKLYEATSGYRVSIFSPCQNKTVATASMFWAVLTGTAIGFLIAVVSITLYRTIFTRRDTISPVLSNIADAQA